MAVFDISEKKGVWFDYPGGGRVQLKTITPSDYLRISKATTKTEPIWKEGMAAPMPFELRDQDMFAQMVNDTAICAWEGMFDENQKEIPCSFETKSVLMRLEDPAFRNFVNKKIEMLEKAEKEKREALEKN